jgi:hypothetical protein
MIKKSKRKNKVKKNSRHYKWHKHLEEAIVDTTYAMKHGIPVTVHSRNGISTTLVDEFGNIYVLIDIVEPYVTGGRLICKDRKPVLECGAINLDLFKEWFNKQVEKKE